MRGAPPSLRLGPRRRPRRGLLRCAVGERGGARGARAAPGRHAGGLCQAPRALRDPAGGPGLRAGSGPRRRGSPPGSRPFRRAGPARPQAPPSKLLAALPQGRPASRAGSYNRRGHAAPRPFCGARSVDPRAGWLRARAALRVSLPRVGSGPAAGVHMRRGAAGRPGLPTTARVLGSGVSDLTRLLDPRVLSRARISRPRVKGWNRERGVC